jgi:hypothetical protein
MNVNRAKDCSTDFLCTKTLSLNIIFNDEIFKIINEISCVAKNNEIPYNIDVSLNLHFKINSTDKTGIF